MASEDSRGVRVLMLIDSFSFGGAERLLATLAVAGRSAGLEVMAASLAPRTPERTGMEPVLVAAGIPLATVGVTRLADPRAVSRVAAVVRQSGCDVVHAHLGYSTILATAAGRLTGVPVISTLHHIPGPASPRARVKEWLSVQLASRSDGFVFVSDAARRAFADRYRPHPRTWTVIRNGIDLVAFSPKAARLPRELGIPADVPVVTLVAAMRRPKGHATALAAFASVLHRVPEARLLLVGNGPEERRLRSLTAGPPLENRVVFAGMRHDVERLLQATTLAVLPSHTEALPTSLIEAAACGRAAVATRVGGTPEVVEDGVTGVLVPPGDASSLATAITGLLEDEDRRTAMGVAARRLAEERFDHHRWARELHALYATAAGMRPPVEAGVPMRPLDMARDAGDLTSAAASRRRIA
jgi:glycosyltransferase involved in cell wall biosynthesis